MYVRVRVVADAKRECCTRTSDDTVEISVRQPAKQNLANTRVRELIAEQYRVPFGSVRIVSGHRSPVKVISVEVTDV